MEPDIRQKMTFDECVKVFLRQDYLYFAATAIVSSETNKDMAFAITTGANSSYMYTSFEGRAQNMVGSFNVNP